jgi:hypothetical protein
MSTLSTRELAPARIVAARAIAWTLAVPCVTGAIGGGLTLTATDLAEIDAALAARDRAVAA